MHYLKDILNFILITVALKIVVAHWVAQHLQSILKKLFAKERNSAILSHFKARALGVGHFTESVLHCGEGDCAIFSN